ncbi:MAG: hemerythrin family protein [Pseudomonadota bacterium]
METFVWNRHFFTGIELVDSQHRRLVEITNELGEVMRTGDEMSEGRMQILFKELADYAREHFHDEEGVMRKAGVDARHVEAHVGHHHQFVEQLTSMWRARTSMRHPAEVFHGFLSAWLTCHILGEDQVMARQMARIEAGESPEVAYELEKQPPDNGTAVLLDALRNVFHLLAEQNRDLAEAHQRLLKEIAAHRDSQ